MDGSQRISAREFVTALAWPDPAARRRQFAAASWREILERLDPQASPRARLTTPPQFVKARTAGWLLHVPRWRPLSAMKRTGLASMNFLAATAKAIPAGSGWLYGAALTFFQDARVQTLVRSALLAGGMRLYLQVHPNADPAAAAAADFADQVAGIGMMAFSLILSQIAHSGKGSPVSGTAAAPPAPAISAPPATVTGPAIVTGNFKS